MNTAARDRALLPAVRNVLPGRTPISKLKLSKEKNGDLTVALHTSRPDSVRVHTQELSSAIVNKIGGQKTVKVVVVPEARAVAKFVRTSPRKARLVIDVIKGKRVSEAIAMLHYIPNHAAEHISKVLKSAAANAMDGWGKGPEELKIVNILADGGPSFKRVRARAQGRAYRIVKRTSHLTVILTDAPAETPKPKRTAAPKPKAAKTVAAAKPVAEEPKASVVEPVEVQPVDASDAQQDPGTGADQLREEGE